MAKHELVELAADIVTSYVSNNSVAVDDVPGIIPQVYSTLVSLQTGAPNAEQGKSPVVPVRSSVKANYIVCLECGKKGKTLRRHLQMAHGKTREQYRKDYGLPVTYPLTAPNYSETRRNLAKAIGLGRNREKAPVTTSAKASTRKARRKVT